MTISDTFLLIDELREELCSHSGSTISGIRLYFTSLDF